MNKPQRTIKQGESKPPRWAEIFLSWYCRPELLEDLQGDLNEYFYRNVKTKGRPRARLIYILDVLKFIRGYTVRTPKFLNLLIQWIMIGSYIKTSGRSIVRNKLFSSINIIGLAVSMSVGLIMIGMLLDLNSYDKFHEKHARIYRVKSQYQYNGRKDNDFHASTSLKAARSIEDSFTGVEDVVIFTREFSGDVKAGEKTIPLSGLWANESLFNVFSFSLLEGNPVTALKAPFSVVLTETSAKKLFGDSSPLGKTVVLNNDREYTVTGILEDVPAFSHIHFDMLGSLSTREITQKDSKREMAWDNMWGNWTYLLLPENADLDAIRKEFDKLSEREDKGLKLTNIKLDLQPMDDIVVGESMSNQIGIVMGETVVWIFGALSFIVILSACLNYTNLSIARSFRRSKEVGIRKTIGALKSHVVGQFIVESVIISLLALVLAFGLFLLVKPHFLSVERSLQEMLTLQLSPGLVFAFIAFAIVIGVCAGFFPALFFSRFNAIQVMKNLTTVPVFKGMTLRKSLLVFQYSISIIAISATMIIYTQYRHFIAYDLGFTTDNIINIPLQGNKADILKKEILQMPEVKDISQSSLILSIGNYWTSNMKNPNDPEDSATVSINFVDEKYLPLHDHQLLAGRNFSPRPEKSEESEIIVNLQALKRFNLANEDPSKAIDMVVKVDRKDLTIVGVMKDFSYGRANFRGNKEVVIRQGGPDMGYLNVKIQSDDWLGTYARLEKIWKTIDPVHPFEAKFYSEQIEESFRGLQASIKVGGFLAFLVICISSFGLLGMVVFTTETRLKEISIRKVMGANEAGLLLMLSSGFLYLLFIAAGIAIPATWLFFDKILLPELANHAPLLLTDFLTGLVAVMVIALIMIGSQTLKASRTNPAEILKNE